VPYSTVQYSTASHSAVQYSKYRTGQPPTQPPSQQPSQPPEPENILPIMPTPDGYTLLDSKRSDTTYSLNNDPKNWILTEKTKEECADICNSDYNCLGFNYSKNPTMYVGYTCSLSNVTTTTYQNGIDFYLKNNSSSPSPSSPAPSSPPPSSPPPSSPSPSSPPPSPSGYTYNESKESNSTYPVNNDPINWLLLRKTKDDCANVCNSDYNCIGFNYSKNIVPYAGYTCSFSRINDLKYSSDKNFYSKN
jgi:hypothetical protein